jgi:hypothetical protein
MRREVAVYMLLSYQEADELARALAPISYMDPVFCESMLSVFEQLDTAAENRKKDTNGYFYGGAHIDLDEEQYNLIIICTDWRPAVGPFWR